MRDIRGIIAEEIEQQENIRGLYQKHIKKLPKGRLSAACHHGNVYYTRICGSKRKYIGKIDNPEVGLLQKRYFIEESIRRLNSNIYYMGKLLEKFKSVSAADILTSAPKAYKDFSEVNTLLSRDWLIEEWEQAEYSKSAVYPERLIHRTIKGEYVRSKSEALLANSLYANGIPYRYEEIRYIGGQRTAPDFTILVVRTHKIILWEHFGMINNLDYLCRCMEKIQRYLSNGYKLWEDLIITFDSIDKSIDTHLIETIIDTFLK